MDNVLTTQSCRDDLRFHRQDPGSGESYCLRRMESGDLEQVCELERESFPTPWSRSAFEAELKARLYSQPFVIEHRRRVIAFVIAWFIADELHIANIAVAVRYRRRGIASWVLGTLFDMARRDGMKEVYLEVRTSNEGAIRLYRNFGFTVIDVRRNYYVTEGEDALIMRRLLTQEPSH